MKIKRTLAEQFAPAAIVFPRAAAWWKSVAAEMAPAFAVPACLKMHLNRHGERNLWSKSMAARAETEWNGAGTHLLLTHGTQAQRKGCHSLAAGMPRAPPPNPAGYPVPARAEDQERTNPCPVLFRK